MNTLTYSTNTTIVTKQPKLNPFVMSIFWPLLAKNWPNWNKFTLWIWPCFSMKLIHSFSIVWKVRIYDCICKCQIFAYEYFSNFVFFKCHILIIKNVCLCVRCLSPLITPDPLIRFWRNFLLSTRNLPSLGMTKTRKKISISQKNFDFANFFPIFFEVLVLLIFRSILKFDFFANIR